MECNKEEAFRAKEIAEKKMQNKDFIGARKFVLKAQQLHPETENISQLLSVCDVHCFAENRKFGNEMDWYGILQVEQTADDTVIKKQYRKFALLLHPDKNQFAGAEAAFKLIGEAQRVLLDKQKRAFHDAKRRTSYKPVVSHQPPQSRPPNNFPSNPNSHYRASNFPSQGKTQHASVVDGKETFWTLCIHCTSRYQYFKEVLCRTIVCPSCKKPFAAFDMNASRYGATQPVFPNPKAKIVKPAFGVGYQAGEKAEVSSSTKGPNKVETKVDEKSKLRKKNRKRRKKHVVESSESFESDSSLDSEEVEIHETVYSSRPQHFDRDGERQTRRSNRNKKHVSYNENAVDDELVATPSKKAKENGSMDEKVNPSNISGSAFGEDVRDRECNMDDGNETLAGSANKSVEAENELDSSLEQTPESIPEPTLYEYPDPEFCDFDKSRENHCFKNGELWAAYDTVDAMPRYYAKIKRVYGSGFKMQITWLETDPDDDLGRKWIESELPFACGKFKLGNTETTEDFGMFSHVVCGCKSIGRNSFLIYPRAREIWAIFKNWDANWWADLEMERKFEYEFVEILTDYDETAGIRVAPLVKLKGFGSLFYPKSVNEIQIGPSEILRFSHMVPCYRTTGQERKGVPNGAFELDPACTTLNLEEITLSQ